MEMLNKKLEMKLKFRGEVWAGNKNDQVKDSNLSLETKCNHTGHGRGKVQVLCLDLLHH